MKKPPSESGSEADDANEEVKVAKPPKRDILDWTEESEPSFANQAYKNFVNPSSESATERSDDFQLEEVKAQKRDREGDKLRTFF